MFIDMKYQRAFLLISYINRRKKSINGPINEKKLQNGKKIRKLLLTVTVVNLERFIIKSKSIIYIEVFIEIYNQRNYEKVYQIYKMIELEKLCILTTHNPHILGAYYIIKIFLVLRNIYIIQGNQERI